MGLVGTIALGIVLAVLALIGLGLIILGILSLANGTQRQRMTLAFLLSFIVLGAYIAWMSHLDPARPATKLPK